MLIELLLKPIFALFGFIVGLLPDMSGLDPLAGFDVSGLIDSLAYGFLVFPFSLFVAFVGNVMFWLATQMVWALIEWAYKKIPGVG